jgi:4-hydroxy-tetrahydrodipicolinate synthase
MMSKNTLRGIFVPTLTPIDEDLAIDVQRWVELCKHLLETGAHGLCPFGTTSEANSFSVGERENALEQLIDSGVDPAVLMPGTGCVALTDSVRLTSHAVEHGCGGVLFLPPYYYKGVSDEGLYRSVAETIERVGDDRLRIYLYHIPPQAVIGWSLDLIERLITDFPDTVVGIKDSSGDWNNMNGILTRFPEFGLFTGSELFFKKVLERGGVGTINAVANLIVSSQRKLYDNYEGPEADELQAKISELRPIYSNLAPIPAIKQMMAHYHDDDAWLRVRPPLVPLSDGDATALIERAEALPVMADAKW